MKQVATKDYVKLQLLQSLWADDTAWQKNVSGNVGKKGYTIATDSDDGEAIVERLQVRDMQHASVTVYDFMGSEHEQEQFYIKDVEVFKHKVTKDFWVIETDDIYSF